MEIQYVIINFIILALILFVFGRKTVKRIFSSRYEKINKELDEAEELEKLTMPVFEPFVPDETKPDMTEEVVRARNTVNEKISQIKDYGTRGHSEIHREMIEDARKELFSIMKENVINLFSYEKSKEEIRKLDRPVIDAILEKIKLTPGDMADIIPLKQTLEITKNFKTTLRGLYQ